MIRHSARLVNHGDCLLTVWHDSLMRTGFAILLALIIDAFAWLRLCVESTESNRAEDLFLRRQLGLYIERDVQPRRIDPVTRVRLVLLSKLFDRPSHWRDALIVVQPETLRRWHRSARRMLWRMRSRPGRAAVPGQLQGLIRPMATENPLWGEERIAHELLLKLGIHISPRTVRKHMPGAHRADREEICAGRPSYVFTLRKFSPATSASPSRRTLACSPSSS